MGRVSLEQNGKILWLCQNFLNSQSILGGVSSLAIIFVWPFVSEAACAGEKEDGEVYCQRVILHKSFY